MMRIAKLVLCLGSVAMAWANAAKPYDVTITNPAVVAGTELTAGAYRVEVAGDKAMIRGNKQSVEASIKVEEGDQKFSVTTVRYSILGGKYRVDEIHLGGTKTKLVFNN